MFTRIITSLLIAALMMGATGAPAQSVSKSEDTVAQITAQNAEEVALAHAGLTATEVTGLHTQRDRENGVPVYEVEFRVDEVEYDYTIHRETGEILENHREYDPEPTPPTLPDSPVAEPPVTEAPVTETPVVEAPAAETPVTEAPAQTLLTREEALAIALSHAGLTQDQIRKLEVEGDQEHGVPVFDIEFDFERWEYSYEIDRNSGKILEWEKEQDD